MGGEFWTEIVYGFEFTPSFAKLRGGKNVYIGTKGRGYPPIYYSINLKSKLLDDVQKEIDNLTESQRNQMQEFDKFAERYGQKAKWQIACIGDLSVDVCEEPKKEYVLERLKECIQIMNEMDEPIYEENGGFTEDAREYISVVFDESYIGFLLENALKLRTFEEIYEMIEQYYALEK